MVQESAPQKQTIQSSQPSQAVIEARKSLEEMKGIGSWTADCYLMACLGRQDIWPVGDIGLQEGVRRLKDLKERPNVEDMTCLAREWRPFRSVAANLLWADYD